MKESSALPLYTVVCLVDGRGADKSLALYGFGLSPAEVKQARPTRQNLYCCPMWQRPDVSGAAQNCVSVTHSDHSTPGKAQPSAAAKATGLVTSWWRWCIPAGADGNLGSGNLGKAVFF